MHVFIDKRYTVGRLAHYLYSTFTVLNIPFEKILFSIVTPLERKLQQTTTFSVINIIVYVNFVI